jgi:hypothetical protein
MEISVILAKKITEVNNNASILKDLATMDVKETWDEAFNMRCDTCAPLGAARCIEVDADFRHAEGEFSPNKWRDLVPRCKLNAIKGCDNGLTLSDSGKGHQRGDKVDGRDGLHDG